MQHLSLFTLLVNLKNFVKKKPSREKKNAKRGKKHSMIFRGHKAKKKKKKKKKKSDGSENYYDILKRPS